MIRKLSLLAAAAVLATGAAHAATQGVADSTSSTGSFTNTVGSTPTPQVRVFGLQDATFNSLAQTTDSPWGTVKGTSDSFCVAHSTGGNVLLTFSYANAYNTTSGLTTAVTSGGGSIDYRNAIKVGTGSWTVMNSSTHTMTVNAAQTDLVNCTAPNVQKSVFTDGVTVPTTAVYTDTATVVATPL